MLPFSAEHAQAIPIAVVSPIQFSAWLATQSLYVQTWLKSTNFLAEPKAMRLIPDSDGNLSQILFIISQPLAFWEVGNLSISLPAGLYRFTAFAETFKYRDYALSWGLGAYQFTRYKKPTRIVAHLYIPPADFALVNDMVRALYLVRDLINTPAEDLQAPALAAVCEELARQYHAQFNQLCGDELLAAGYQAIHTVGRAGANAPRLLDLRWGQPNHFALTLVGKGVCFDTGGLDLKSATGMQLMKKDMGGAAHVLGLAQMIMQANLPVNLRVLIPAVENGIGSQAYRPGDIIKSRNGRTIEIGNTDAEGRVILAEALAEAASTHPNLIIDMATLTGAARVAVGTEIAAVFSNHDTIVNDVIRYGVEYDDPIWRLPLYAGYRDFIKSGIADLNNHSTDGYAGAIVAALFLQEFVVPATIPWLHFDIMAWNLRERPGRPIGGEAMGLRALFAYIQHCAGITKEEQRAASKN